MPEVLIKEQHNTYHRLDRSVIGEHLFKFSYSTHTIKGRCVGGSINFEKPLLPLCLGELEQQFVSHDQI